jgi:hypothetical protein
MASTPNFAWPTPDDTDPVGDGALDIRTLADAIDTQVFAGGLVLVKRQTIGTGVSSVTVTGAFSSLYENYLITVSGGSNNISGSALNLKLGATVTGYYYSLSYTTYNTTPAATGGSNVGNWDYVGSGQTTGLNAFIELNSPFLSKGTSVRASIANSTFYAGNQAGYLNNSTSYTSFILSTAVGTMTGGTIRVYGMRN